MSKLKISIILGLVFVIGVAGGLTCYHYFNAKNSADLADGEQASIIERSFDDFYCGEGEDGHQEYEVSRIEFSDKFEIYPDEPLNTYSYQPLEAAGILNDIINAYFDITLVTDGILAGDDGYQNYATPTTDEQSPTHSSYYVSANYYTGKFSLNILRSTEEITAFVKEYASYDLAKQHSLMLANATDFAEQFAGITGKLKLEYEETVDISECIYDDPANLREYLYQGKKFYFTSIDGTTTNLNLTPNYNTPLTYNDRAKIYFTVTVRPDGAICMAENMLTLADITQSDEKPPLTREYLQKLAFIFTSLTENDTVIFDEISSITYSNYFGYTTIEPYITVKYHFLSKPDDILETSFVYNLDWIY